MPTAKGLELFLIQSLPSKVIRPGILRRDLFRADPKHASYLVAVFCVVEIACQPQLVV